MVHGTDVWIEQDGCFSNVIQATGRMVITLKRTYALSIYT